jgi:hypothetical protein
MGMRKLMDWWQWLVEAIDPNVSCPLVVSSSVLSRPGRSLSHRSLRGWRRFCFLLQPAVRPAHGKGVEKERRAKKARKG